MSLGERCDGIVIYLRPVSLSTSILTGHWLMHGHSSHESYLLKHPSSSGSTIFLLSIHLTPTYNSTYNYKYLSIFPLLSYSIEKNCRSKKEEKAKEKYKNRL